VLPLPAKIELFLLKPLLTLPANDTPCEEEISPSTTNFVGKVPALFIAAALEAKSKYKISVLCTKSSATV
jgi:hypothetical protein